MITRSVQNKFRTLRRLHQTAVDSELLSEFACDALRQEAELTPKPGLVDRRGSGAHADLTLDLMYRSAATLKSTFRQMARAARGQQPTIALRERLGAIGREGERRMLLATNQVNTHRGAIWSLGLLVAAAAMNARRRSPTAVALRAAILARLPDRHAPPAETNGWKVVLRFGVAGARGEAAGGFRHVLDKGLPALRASRSAGVPELHARLNALLAIMSSLDDTCLLHRGGRMALLSAKRGAQVVLDQGGAFTRSGWLALRQLDRILLAQNASPGGSADLLSATLFLDRVIREDLYQWKP